jgi:hypothetical protein
LKVLAAAPISAPQLPSILSGLTVLPAVPAVAGLTSGRDCPPGHYPKETAPDCPSPSKWVDPDVELAKSIERGEIPHWKHQELLWEARDVRRIDDDLMGMKSLSNSARKRIQAERDYQRGVESIIFNHRREIERHSWHDWLWKTVAK